MYIHNTFHIIYYMDKKNHYNTCKTISNYAIICFIKLHLQFAIIFHSDYNNIPTAQ